MRQNTSRFYEKEKSAGEHASHAAVTSSVIQSRSEREGIMMMGNKRDVELYAGDDDEEQMSLAVRVRVLMYGLHEKRANPLLI